MSSTKTAVAAEDAEGQLEAVRAVDPAMASAPVFQPPAYISEKAAFPTLEAYQAEYERSINDPDAFWDDHAKKELHWTTPYSAVRAGSFENGDVAWFVDGKLNVSYNCVDRHALATPDKIAILWEGDHPSDIRRITYAQLQREVCRFANALLRRGVRKGDTVCIFMPMVPETAFAMLACARIGAVHAVVFAGFSVESLRDRIVDGQCVAIVTADQGKRGGKTIHLKNIVDRALLAGVDAAVTSVHSVFVLQHTGNAEIAAAMHPGRDLFYADAVARERPVCPPVAVDSEDTLFILFTSGSTGRPKGVQHSSAGYLLYAAMTHKYVFDIKPDDVYACVADAGWITGHTYVVYGPLANGATTLMFESTPMYPDAGRYWDMVQRHKITVFYTSPTAIRSLMRFDDSFVTRYDRSSLRVLGSVGEPINPEAWRWYFNVVGDGKASIADTYWQTETGGIAITALPGAVPTKPGAAGLPFFGIKPVLLRADTGAVIEGNNASGLLCLSSTWPGMLRSCWADHTRFLQTYFTAYPGYYLTGDGAYRDADGHYWITGRVDDVINVSGHRIGSAEIESALVSHQHVAEAAVVGVPHELKGQALFAYVTLKLDAQITNIFQAELLLTVAREVGSFAKPDYIVLCPALPKTRSGKIMRRLLRKVACRETDSLGDLSTLADREVIDDLIVRVNEVYEAAAPKKPV
jgi:acetyl-CoA synthetase